MDWHAWMGDIPTWLTTLAIGVAALSYRTDRHRRNAEEDREAKAQARLLSAWAVTDVDAAPRIYGIVIDNGSGSTFHDVTVQASFFHESTLSPVALVTLPPGRYFVKLLDKEAKSPWDFAVDVASYDGYLRPYTRTEGYKIERVDFTDNLDQRWTTDAHAVLRRVPTAAAAKHVAHR